MDLHSINGPFAPMDDEQVIAATLSAQQGAAGLLGVMGVAQADAGEPLAETARQLAEALHAALSWQPTPDDDDLMLLHALDRWL